MCVFVPMREVGQDVTTDRAQDGDLNDGKQDLKPSKIKRKQFFPRGPVRNILRNQLPPIPRSLVPAVLVHQLLISLFGAVSSVVG